MDFKWLRKQAKNARSRLLVSKIREWHNLVFGKGIHQKSKRLFSIDLGNYKIWMRENGAYSSVDIYHEIFKEKNHFELPEFSGRNSNVIIDLGANEGYYTLKVKENNPLCKVIALEPNPIAFKLLRKNITSNKLRNVFLLNKAAGAKNARINFQIAEQISPIGGKNIRLLPRPWLKEEFIKNIKVDSITLKKIFEKYNLDRVGILKLDVEGMEMEILRASQNILDKIGKIVVEYHSKHLRTQLKSFLKHKGFRLVKERKAKCGELYFLRNK